MPRVSGAASACGLFLGQHDRAFGFACMSEIERDAIRRINLEKVMDSLAEDAAFQSLAQHVRR